MGSNTGKPRGGGGLGSPAPGCCTRKIGGRSSGRGIVRPAAPKPGFGKQGTTRTGFGTGRGIGRGRGIKR